MSIDQFASFFDNVVAKSLYIEASAVGGLLPTPAAFATKRSPRTRATSPSVTSCATFWRTWGSSLSGSPSRVSLFT